MEPALGDLPGWEDMEDTSKAITVKESINKFLLDLPGWEDMEDTSKAITVKESINKFLLDLN